jgi:hypothetical protein
MSAVGSAMTGDIPNEPRELKAFKAWLAPGEKRGSGSLPTRSLACYDAATGWIVEPGEYEVIVGRHSLDENAPRARFTIR